MSIWVEKTFAYGDWAHAQDKFDDLYFKMGGPAGMMLISCTSEDRQSEQLFACLPDSTLASAFTDFTLVTEDRLPTHANLLVGNQSVFMERFNFPTIL